MTSRLAVSIATVEIQRYQDIGRFREHMGRIAARAARAHSRLLLLPELLCLGLLWTDDQAGHTDVEHVAELYHRVLPPLLDDYRRVLSEFAVQYDMTIAGASFWHRESSQGVNIGFFFKSDGSIIEQQKLHPTLGERAINTAGGSGLRVCEIEGVKVGMLICYDIQFPEVTRFLVESGIEILLVPSLTDARGLWRVRHCAHARAVESQLFVCVSPLVGELGIPTERPVHGEGAAFVACPIDNRFKITDGTLARGPENVESVLNCTLDLEVLRHSRTKSEITQLADRRPGLYATLADGSSRT